MYLAHPVVKKSKINIMKSKLETKEPRFHDKIYFPRKMHHCEGSTTSIVPQLSKCLKFDSV